MSFRPQLPVFLLLLAAAAAAIRAQEDDLSQILTDCRPDWENFTSNTPYASNLNTLLPSLAANAVRNPGGYYNATAGADPDWVYGFAQCMSGAAAAACEACFNRSIPDLRRRCANKKRATILYDNCILRYTDQRFVSQLDRSSWVYVNEGNVSEPAAFNRQLIGLLRNLAREAVGNASRASWGRTRVNDSQELFALVQCTRDLGSNDCSMCLDGGIAQIPDCCRENSMVGIYYPSCNIRYDTAAFDPASRAPAPPRGTGSEGDGKSNTRTVIIAVTCGVLSVLAAVSLICICLLQRKKKRAKIIVKSDYGEDLRSSESLLVDLDTLRAATNNFSIPNKLGQGGFGSVYKGTLPDGQEIAVKRLLAGSSQGTAEFKNEVALLAKLQHRNLVRLLGCCLGDGEKLLVYEYVPNTSLDKFLFDPAKSVQLGWNTRYRIIIGIARGLLYLHEDSRLRIIHRDLKAGNILLDSDMNPKISDFGLAKIFGGDQSVDNTSRIAGTYGYMSPEYAMHGIFSVKSDVFSFGVLVLELVTGRKNSCFDTTAHAIDLPDYTWKHWCQGTAMELIDQSLGEDYRRNEVLRCIHLGLLCVQDDPIERPIMSRVVLMLSSSSMTLPRPSPPAFHIGTRQAGSKTSDVGSTQSQQSSNKTPASSIYEVSITELDPR